MNSLIKLSFPPVRFNYFVVASRPEEKSIIPVIIDVFFQTTLQVYSVDFHREGRSALKSNNPAAKNRRQSYGS